MMEQIPKRRGRPPKEAITEGSPLAEVVRRYRLRKGWSQGQLALYTGLSQSFISQLERGQHQTVEPPRLQKIAQVLGAPLRELLEAAGIKEAPDFPIVELDLAAARQATLIQLQAEGIPAESLTDLLEVAPKLVQEDWDLLVEVAQRQARRNAKRVQQRPQRPPSPAPADEDTDSSEDGPPRRVSV